MKCLYLSAVLFLFAAGVSAQAVSDSSELSVLQKKWSMTWRGNPADLLDSGFQGDAFRANNEVNQANRDQKDYLRDRENRKRTGQPPAAAPPSARKTTAQVQQNRNEGSTIYQYQIKVQNNAAKTIQKVVWEYVFFDAKTNQEVGRHQFTSEANLKPRKTGNLVAKLFSPPTGTVNVNDAGKKSSELYAEQINIKSIYYADGSVWQADSK